ncbi:unnamed protein product, partial [Rotaria sordida]
ILNHLLGNYDTSESDDEINVERNDYKQSSECESRTLSLNTTSCLPLHELMNYENNEFDNIHSFNDHLLYIDNDTPLFNGSLITVKKAIRQ